MQSHTCSLWQKALKFYLLFVSYAVIICDSVHTVQCAVYVRLSYFLLYLHGLHKQSLRTLHQRFLVGTPRGKLKRDRYTFINV